MLFSSTIETFLHKVGAKADYYRIDSALRKISEWYIGDGWYSDGPSFAFDYYNSFVIHPMFFECVEVLTDGGKKKNGNGQEQLFAHVTKRIQRYSIILEISHISPEGAFPVFGRSITYTGVLQPLALIVWKGLLPEELSNGQVRTAMTAVIKRMFADGQNFNEKGFLTLGI